MPYMYILECSDGSYYVGSTRNLEHRLWMHNQRLAFAHEFARVSEAFAAEKRVQGWSRKKREALIRGDYAALPGLASRRKKPPRPPTD